MADRRFPGNVYRRGSEPDARFSLANERTFLTWVTTGLALLSVGVALDALVPGLHAGLRKAAAVVLVLAGLAAPLQAWFGWMRTEAALREGTPLPPAFLAPWLVVALVVAGLLVLIGVVVP